jgi:hypothetical protein
MDANNVIVFPRANVNPKMKMQSIEEINKDLEMMKLYHIQETIITLIPLIFNQLEIAGFDVSDQEINNSKDVTFIIEALRSVMCKYYEIYHPVQDIANNIFIPNPEEENSYKIPESINIVFKKDVEAT